MKITICQLNPKVGDFDSNLIKIKKALSQANSEQADLAVFPELFICGYPPADLLHRPSFIQQCNEVINLVCQDSLNYPNLGILLGAPTPHNGKGKNLYNSALLIENGQIIHTQHKQLLPFYDVFDEPRYFDSGPPLTNFKFKGQNLGCLICEDAWSGHNLTNLSSIYHQSPVLELKKQNHLDVVICIMASPFELNKQQLLDHVYSTIAQELNTKVVCVNQVGGQDELVFSGESSVYDSSGQLSYRLASFKETLQTIDLNILTTQSIKTEDQHSRLYAALTLGLKDYIYKSGLSKVVIGLSGGIDSALVAALAVHALGAENVTGILMPSQYSSKGSIEDAKKLASNLGISSITIPINESVTALTKTLEGGLEKSLIGLAFALGRNIIIVINIKIKYFVIVFIIHYIIRSLDSEVNH